MNPYPVYSESNELNFLPVELSLRAQETVVLMVEPHHYVIVYVINPHMMGMIGTVNKDRARYQW